MSDGTEWDRDYEGFTPEERMRVTALNSAVNSRIPNANADEIVRAAQTFENYLTGKSDE